MQAQLTSYQDIGGYLRDVRESLGFDVRAVGQQLNIRAKYLVALEEGRIEEMPGKIYARGYLQHYAEYLGLNKDEIAEAFDRMGEKGKVRYFVPEPTARNYQPGMIIVGVALVVVLGVYHYWYKNHTLPEQQDYEMVSPVPERLVAPPEAPVVPGNDDLFVQPAAPDQNGRQKDSDVMPDDITVDEVVPDEASAEAAASDTATPDAATAAPENATATAGDAPSAAPKPSRAAAKTKRDVATKLPWLGAKPGTQQQ